MFSEHLGREWMMVEEGNADELRAFAERTRSRSTKEPMGRRAPPSIATTRPTSRTGTTSTAACCERGELLVEEIIVQHADLAAVCPGTVNTTRVTAFFDGEKTHILAIAQKFGRGAVADQMDFGGFYTMLDADTGQVARHGLRLARARPRVPPGLGLPHRGLPAADVRRGHRLRRHASRATSRRCSTSAGTSR